MFFEGVSCSTCAHLKDGMWCRAVEPKIDNIGLSEFPRIDNISEWCGRWRSEIFPHFTFDEYIADLRRKGQ